MRELCFSKRGCREFQKKLRITVRMAESLVTFWAGVARRYISLLRDVPVSLHMGEPEWMQRGAPQINLRCTSRVLCGELI